MDELGAPTTRFQQGGNPFVGLMERMGAKMPGSQGDFARVATQQGAKINSAVDDLTMGGLSGSAMNDVGSKVGQIPVDAELLNQITSLAKGYPNLAGKLVPKEALDTAAAFAGTPPTPPMINPDMVIGSRTLSSFAPEQQAAIVKQLGNTATVPGSAGTPGILKEGTTIPFSGPNGYTGIRSMLGREAHLSDGANQDAWFKLQGAFDDAANRAMDSAGLDAKTLSNARGSYSIDRLLAPAKIVLPDGTTQWNPTKIAQIVKTKDATSPSYFDNLPGDSGKTLRDIANAARYMAPTSSSQTTELGVAKGVVTGDVLRGMANEGVGPAASSGMSALAALYAAPWLVNKGLQLTGKGLPFLRQFADQASPPLTAGMGALGEPASNAFFPGRVPTLAEIYSRLPAGAQ